jgi:metal-sulfur cluster biosynthetic enzyme
LIRDIKDPEYAYSLEELQVVKEEDIFVEYIDEMCVIRILFTPTVPHCTLASTIGLCLRAKLNRYLPQQTKIDIYISPGKHNTEHESEYDFSRLI